MMTFSLAGRVWKDGTWWLAECPIADVMTQGKTSTDAGLMLADAIESLVDQDGFKVTVTEVVPDGTLAIVANDPFAIAALILKRRDLEFAAKDGQLDKAESRSAEQYRIIAKQRDMLAERNSQLDATRAAIGAQCVEHVELNGYIDLAEQCLDYLANEANDDSSGKIHDFSHALRIVIDQCDLQRRRANWYEAAYTAGKQKLIESAVERALSRARAAAQVYAERVDALGIAADDNDPRVMATAHPIGAAQADLYAALGLLELSESGEISIRPPTETIEQLRAERDTAKVLADVRGRERDALATQVARQREFIERTSGNYDAELVIGGLVADKHKLAAEVDRLTKEKNDVYAERDRCVAGLAALAVRLGWSAWLGKHPPDPRWDADWTTIVFINLPTGQVSWHIHDSEVVWFSFLPSIHERPWDGHTTPQKYDRLAGLALAILREPSGSEET